MKILTILFLIFNFKNDEYRLTINNLEYPNPYNIIMNYELKNLNYKDGIILPRTLELAVNYESFNANVKIFDLSTQKFIESRTQPDILFMVDFRQECSKNIVLYKNESFDSYDQVLLADTPIPINTPCVFYVAIKIKDCSGNNLFIQSDPFYFKFDGKEFKEIKVRKSKQKNLPIINEWR